MAHHDTFISYATEDNDFASELAYALRSNGLKVWFAPLSLRVGDSLLPSIEAGLRQSRYGVLLLSKNYLAKHWTSYEMDVLIRQHIETGKKILPIWLNVTRAKVEAKSLGLAGIVAITNPSLKAVASDLLTVISEGSKRRGVIPIWEDPAYRFLAGLGEVNLTNADGPATTLYELLIHSKDDEYPFWLAGKSYSKNELLYKAAEILAYDPQRVDMWLQPANREKLNAMCVAAGFDPKSFG